MVVSRFEGVVYPPLARMARLQGIVVVRVRLDKDGKVVDAEGLSGHPILTSASIDGAKKMQFQPNAEKAAVIVYNFKFADVCESKTTGSFSFVEAPASVTVIGCSGTIET
ncbi:MAG: energy transducer TonB [Terriglobales bacterium]